MANTRRQPIFLVVLFYYAINLGGGQTMDRADARVDWDDADDPRGNLQHIADNT
jgi:hypothetical protein